MGTRKCFSTAQHVLFFSAYEQCLKREKRTSQLVLLMPKKHLAHVDDIKSYGSIETEKKNRENAVNLKTIEIDMYYTYSFKRNNLTTLLRIR
jgi:hypothetical protein